jgi:hypothetical protein
MKSLVHRATSGNWSVRRGNEIEIVEPVGEELPIVEGDDDFCAATSTHTQPKCRLGLGFAASVRTAASVDVP